MAWFFPTFIFSKNKFEIGNLFDFRLSFELNTVSTDQHNIHKHLIEGCQRDDSSAQEQIYKLYAGAMFNICKRFLVNEDDAMDLLQESFMDVFRKVKELRDTSFFSAWVKRIVTNNCINALRKRRLETTELEENWDGTVEEEDDFDYQNYRMDKIRSCIASLPEGSRTVLTLYAFEGYDHKEIGEILDITESASKAQYSKAKAKIRKLLDQEGVQYA